MRISYANIVASLALFVALGGTAAAVTALPRDSVGSPQIQKDAVRSPEIAKDAVRSPEIANDAVRAPEIADGAVHSAEIADGAIRVADISTGARNTLKGEQGPPGPAGVSEVRVASGTREVPQCSDQDLHDCPNLLTRTLGAGNWLVQAKLDVSDAGAVPLEHCGLEQGTSELDRADFRLEGAVNRADVETIALSGVLTNAANGTTVALRCSELPGEDIFAAHMVITAAQVTTVLGP
jgi:hypothetical protein